MGAGTSSETSLGSDLEFAVRRYWWVLLFALALSLVVGFVLTPEADYESSFRATVLIPGDTEDTGSSERPELMVLDDLGPFVESWVFADAVASEAGGELAVDDVYGMVGGSRYSRIATVTVTGPEAEQVARVADAAAAVFPTEVNAFLVAPGDPDATVQIIDPPVTPERDTTMRWVRVGATGLLGAAFAMALIVVFSPGPRASQVGASTQT